MSRIPFMQVIATVTVLLTRCIVGVRRGISTTPSRLSPSALSCELGQFCQFVHQPATGLRPTELMAPYVVRRDLQRQPATQLQRAASVPLGHASSNRPQLGRSVTRPATLSRARPTQLATLAHGQLRVEEIAQPFQFRTTLVHRPRLRFRNSTTTAGMAVRQHIKVHGSSRIHPSRAARRQAPQHPKAPEFRPAVTSAPADPRCFRKSRGQDAQETHDQVRGCVQHNFNDFFKHASSLFSARRQAWDTCSAQIHKLWNGYLSPHLEVGSFVWVYRRDVEDDFVESNEGLLDYLAGAWNAATGNNWRQEMYVAEITGYMDDGWFEALLYYPDFEPYLGTDGIHQLKFTAHEDNIAEDADFPLIVQATLKLPCVAEQIQVVKDTMWQVFKTSHPAFAEIVTQVKEAFETDSWSAVVKFELGASFVSLLPRSLRVSGGVGFVIHPASARGTVLGEACGGKDSMHFSLDWAAGLEIGLENKCFSGKELEFEIAPQLPGGWQLFGSASLALRDKAPYLPEMNERSMPVLDAFAFGFGWGVKGQIPSPWNPFASVLAESQMVCKQFEVLGVGPRDETCPGAFWTFEQDEEDG